MKENVILLIDNFSGHKLLDNVNLKFTKLLFLPKNSTSVHQPLDQGQTLLLSYSKQCIHRESFENPHLRINSVAGVDCRIVPLAEASSSLAAWNEFGIWRTNHVLQSTCVT